MTNETRLLVRNLAEDYLKNLPKDVVGPSDFPVQIENIIQHLKGSIIEDVVDIYSDGYIKYTNKNIPIFEIHIRKISDEQRKRFTLAHELGHLFLHMDFFDEKKRKKHQVYQDCIYHRKSGNYAEEELQANEFAASILMPTDVFIQKAEENIVDGGSAYDVEKIAAFFNVSHLTVITRGRWLGLFAWDNSF